MNKTTTVAKPVSATKKVAAAKAAPKVKTEAKAKAAPKTETKVVAPVAGLTSAMLKTLTPKLGGFIATGLKYHGAKGRVGITKEGIVKATKEGAAFFAARSTPDTLAAAVKGLTEGLKMAQGMEFCAAPAGFRFKHVPVEKYLSAGRADSQAVFAAMIL